MAQKLGDNHYPPMVEMALRFMRIRLKSRAECAALADETAAVRAELRQKRDAWDDAVDETRAATADVIYRDGKLDVAVKVELKASFAAMIATMPAKQRDAMTAKLFGGKAPSEGMKYVGGPAQDHYVDGILGHLATPDFAPLSAVTTKLTTLRADLGAAEQNRASRRTAEQVARSAVEDSSDTAKRFYNQMHARLELLFPDDPDFVESCFLDLRTASPDPGEEARKKALLAVYRARHGAVPRGVQGALDELDDAKFGEYVVLFATKGAEEIAAAIVAKG
jgi:hypothetical protein